MKKERNDVCSQIEVEDSFLPETMKLTVGELYTHTMDISYCLHCKNWYNIYFGYIFLIMNIYVHIHDYFHKQYTCKFT